eukprot:6206167-Pleurochrysis_carterae.AAC.3
MQADSAAGRTEPNARQLCMRVQGSCDAKRALARTLPGGAEAPTGARRAPEAASRTAMTPARAIRACASDGPLECECVCASVCVRACSCVRACVWEGVGESARANVCARACVHVPCAHALVPACLGVCAASIVRAYLSVRACMCVRARLRVFARTSMVQNGIQQQKPASWAPQKQRQQKTQAEAKQTRSPFGSR